MTKDTIYKSNDNNSFIVMCDCRCSGLRIEKGSYSHGETEYYIYTIVDAFSSEQTTVLQTILKRIKLAYKILTKGTYWTNEIVMTEDQFLRFKMTIGNFK